VAKSDRRPPKTAEPWYANGLRFECTHCNQCCGGPPGYVWVTDEEVTRIARFLGLQPLDFRERYCRSAWWRTSLRERPNGDCVLLTAEGCSAYPVRPAQCQTFPFWQDVLRSRRRWEDLKDRCPGIDRGRLYTRAEIEQIARQEQST